MFLNKEPWNYSDGRLLFIKPTCQEKFFPIGNKNFAKAQYRNKYAEEVKKLFEEEIEAFENRVAVPQTAPTPETLALEHSEVLVLDVTAQSTTLSLSILDNLDWDPSASKKI